jgi:uncharacterized protein involved in cysteine biosynthesis
MEEQPKYTFSAGNFFRDFMFTLNAQREALVFIRNHKLWTGFWSYGWLSKFLLIIGLLFGLRFFLVFLDWTNLLKGGAPMVVGASFLNLFEDVYREGATLFSLGWMKYVILILTEVMVFHFVRRTLFILTGEEQDDSFKSFIEAQKRMIKVVIRSWVFEMIFWILLSIVFSIFGLKFLHNPAMFLIQCFFLGFAVADNYNERYGLSLSQSQNRFRTAPGVVVAIGLIAYLLLLIPLIGFFLAPFLTAVSATLVMFEYEARGVFPPVQPIESPEEEAPST